MFGGSRSTEVVDCRPTGEHKIVVAYVFTILQLDLSARHIDARNRSQTEVHILLTSENAPHGRPYVFGVQQRSGYLIKERLEGVIVVSIDESHVDGNVGQVLGDSESTKSGAHSH